MGNILSKLLSNPAIQWLFNKNNKGKKIVMFLIICILYNFLKPPRVIKKVEDTDIKSDETELKWVNIPPTPHTTLPRSYFILYSLCTTLALFPIHTIVCSINGIYKLLLYIINKLFFSRCKSLLTPIKPSADSYVIITGAASGIGYDMTQCYAERGFSLILIDVNSAVKSYAQSLANKFTNQSFEYLTIDLSKSNAADTIYETIINEWKIQNVVILVNNAGFGLSGEFLNQDVNKLKTMITVNSIICMELGHKFGRYFVMRQKGRICQMASVAAYLPGAHHAVYHATKAFIRNWAVAFNYELMGTGVGITIINPGPVRTLFAKQSNMKQSLIFGKMEKHFTYSSMSVAKAAVNATLNGKREIVHGPLFHVMQNIFGVFGETYNIMTGKYMQQDRQANVRSAFEKYKMC